MRHHRPGCHRETEDPDRQRCLPRCRPRAPRARAGSWPGGPGPPDRIPLQRPGLGGGGRDGGGRRGRDRGEPDPPRASVFDLEAPDPAFRRRSAGTVRPGREPCYILDDVRCGPGSTHGSSWEPVGVAPDLSAWSKAIANGYALGAVLGRHSLADAARSIYTTGSFWFAAVSMAASLATLQVLEAEDTVGRTVMTGTLAAPRPGRSGGDPGDRRDAVGSGTDAVPDLRRRR